MFLRLAPFVVIRFAGLGRPGPLILVSLENLFRFWGFGLQRLGIVFGAVASHCSLWPLTFLSYDHSSFVYLILSLLFEFGGRRGLL